MLIVLLFLNLNTQAQTALKWATLLQQAGGEEFIVYDSHFDSLANQLLLTGKYKGTNFPATTGISTSNGQDAAFIVSMAPDGSQINWAKLLQGSGEDKGYYITTNEVGDIFVSGSTKSTDFDINGITPAYQSILNQGYSTTLSDVFLLRFDPTGTTLKYGTFIGDAEGNDLYNGGSSLVAIGDKVYGLYDPNTGASGYIIPTYSTPGFQSGPGFFYLNTAVGGTASLEGMAYYQSGYVSGGLNVAPNGEVYIMGTYNMYNNINDGIPDVSTPDAILNQTEVTALSATSDNSGYIDYLAKFNADLTSLEYSSFIIPIELSLTDGKLHSYDYYDIEFDEAGNIYLYSNYWLADDVIAVNYPEGVTIHNPFNMEIGPSTTADGIGTVVKIAGSNLSAFEWITLLPSHEFGGGEDMEIDSKGRIHMNTNIVYNNAFPFSPLTTAGASLSSSQDNPSDINRYYMIFNSDGTLRYSTLYQTSGSFNYKTLTLDKANCTAYLTHSGIYSFYSQNVELSTPSYYDQTAGQTVTVYNGTANNKNGSGILAFHEPIPENTITDFSGGNNTFCVDGLIYQNPNDGPILGNETGYESGDGTSATHNLPDFYFQGTLKEHPDPIAPSFQWQVSRDNGATWEDIAGANLAVLKPEPETVAGTVQYRRTMVNSCCATTSSSNVATATISGNFNLNITTPSDPVYYCEGTTENIPITINGASGNISWQWYNGFSPLTNAEINPASGTNVAAGSFTAQLPSSQNEEGFYRLVVEDASGCKKEVSITFAKLSAPAYASGATAAMCPGTTPSITLGPSAENVLFDYSWTGPSGFTSSLAKPTVSTPGAYFLQVKLKTDASFCVAGQTSVTVIASTPHDAALTTIANTEFCQPDDPEAIGLNGTAPVGYVFQWSPGINFDNQQAYNPIFDPGILPFGTTPIAEVEYTFTALRLSDGCIFETTTMVTDTALALANAGSDQGTCGTNSAILGRVETTGLHWQWEAVGTTYPSGLAALVADANFQIDGSNANAGTNKFASIQTPTATTDCYDIYYVLRASYVPFPTNCFTTDTVRVAVCPPSACNPCPTVFADLQGANGVCGGENSLITASTIEGFELEWTTYSIDGVVQPAGTAPQGLFTNNNGIQGTAINATGSHPEEIIVNFDDATWGWSGANIVTYQVRTTGTVSGTSADCSLLVQVFSGQNGTPTVGVLDKSLCVFPAPGTELGASGNISPYTLNGTDYTQAPNSGLNWTWTELDGSLTSISGNGNTPFPTITQDASADYLVIVQDPVTGCIARDTMTINTVSVVADAGVDITGVCEGSLVQLGSPERANHSYTWSPTAGLNFPIGTANSTAAQPYVTLPAAPSGITYSVTVTESTAGCQATDEVTITTNTDPPTAMSNRNYTNCPGTTRLAFIENAQQGRTYSWAIVSGGGSLSWFDDVANPRPNISIPASTSAGAYVFELTKTKGNCGSTTAQLTLNVVNSPIANLGADITATCSTPFIRIGTTQEASVRYKWTPIEGLYTDAAGTMPYDGSENIAYFEMYVAAPISDTEYTLSARLTCTTTDAIIVSNPTTMDVDAGQDGYYCPDATPISLGVANTGLSHSWTATGYNSDPIEVPATPTSGESSTMLTYLNSTSSNVVNFNQSTYTPGVYVYQLTSSDGGGCTFSDEVKVIVPDLQSGFAGTSKTTCEGQPVTIGATNIISGYSLQWSALSPSTEGYTINDPSLTNPTISPVVTTVYQALATNVATGCQVIEYVTVNVTPNPSIADVSMATQCAPINAVDLTVQIPSYASYANQVWYQNSVPGTVVNTPTSISSTQTTEYFLIAENAQGCPDTAMVTVNVDNPQTPIIIPSVMTDCPISTIDLADYQGTPSNPAYTLEWHTDNTTDPATLLTNTIVGIGTYYLFETTANGCASTSDALVVSSGGCAIGVCGVPNITNISPSNPSNCPALDNGSLVINATGSNLEYSINNGVTYQESNTFSGLSNGNYNIRVRNSNSGCTDSATNTLTDPSCIEVCDDGLDNDGDGQIDCADGDCINYSPFTLVNDSFNACPGFIIERNLASNDVITPHSIYSLQTAPSKGVAVFQEDGRFSYISFLEDCLDDTFIYQVCDTITNCCETATVFIDLSDDVAPQLYNVPDDLTVHCDEIIPVPPLVSAFDNCPQIAIEVEELSTQGEDGCSLHDYELTRIWTATDQCGNQAIDSQLVRVRDITAPDIFRIYTLPNGKKMVAGVMENVNENWKTISLPIDFPTTPLVFTQVVTMNENSTVTTRIRNVSRSQFDLKIQEEDGEDGVHLRESVAWMAIEEGNQSTDFVFESRMLTLNDQWANINFLENHNPSPSLFGTLQTTYDTDPAALRYRNLNTNNAQIQIEEESSVSVNVSHSDEQIAFLGIAENINLTDHNGAVLGETGKATVNHNWQTITTELTYYNPVVIAGIPSHNGGSPGTVRIRNVGANSFEINFQEWNYEDGYHNSEEIAYMIIEGSIPLDASILCETGEDSLEIGKDIVAIDNCDINVALQYDETEIVDGNAKQIIRTWYAVDECGNATGLSQIVPCTGVGLQLKVMLQGAMLSNNEYGLMRDDLRRKKLLPTKEPYTKMATFDHVGAGGGEECLPEVFDKTGNEGIVDWVFVELKQADNQDVVIATCAALLQRNGQVINTEGDSILYFDNLPSDNYYVAIRHRNHLKVETLNPYLFNETNIPFIDFSHNFLPTIGEEAFTNSEGGNALWSGDLNQDEKTIYQGPNNDIFRMFLHVIIDSLNQNYLTNFISRGYTENDFNLDGSVIYQGPNNDRANLLFNTVLKHPKNNFNASNFILSTREQVENFEDCLVDKTLPGCDFDGDGKLNRTDSDDDNDGVIDGNDIAPFNPVSDSDGDGIKDEIETQSGSNPLNACDPFQDHNTCEAIDADGDGKFANYPSAHSLFDKNDLDACIPNFDASNCGCPDMDSDGFIFVCHTTESGQKQTLKITVEQWRLRQVVGDVCGECQ